MAVDKAKHAFGSSSRIEQALASGAIDAFDILFLDGETDNPKVGWVDRDGNIVIVPCNPEDDVRAVDALPASGEIGVIYIVNNEVHIWTGAEFVKISESTDLSAFEGRVAALEASVADVESKVSELEAEVAEKASAEEVAALETAVASKADAEKVEALEAEVATKANAEEVAEAVAEIEKTVEEKFEAVLAQAPSMEYEITNTPVGTLVDYREKEIRVMCPADTQWVTQNVGATGNANMYYMGFKAYAPEGAVSFKEGDRGVIVDEMFDFSGDFAGTDEYGRNYSIVWLALASYDAASDTWTYFGKNSSFEKYIGWDYVVEWYNADGIVIASDHIRINLANESCYSEIKPFYMSSVEAEIKKYTEEMVENKINEIKEIPVVEF